MRLQPGTSLQGGRYRIIDVLGQGGFGITYLAEQVMAERKVCIKEFFPKEYYNRDANLRSISLGTQGSAEIMERYKAKFVKEAQTIAHLDHPNIIHILDVFEENNTCYYAMDYIEGESLSERVKRGGAMSERDAVAYIKQVASALAHIHEQQIMHLDVKPGNIMVRTKDDHAILIDFGLSKHYDENSGEATSTTPVGVSHGYAPIEQYKQGGVNRFSPETDIYSLGATLYYIATGIVPPHAADMGKDGIGELPRELSSGVCAAIRKSMNYWKEDRPHTIKEFLELLDSKTATPIVPVVANEKTTLDSDNNIASEQKSTRKPVEQKQETEQKKPTEQKQTPKAAEPKAAPAEKKAAEPKKEWTPKYGVNKPKTSENETSKKRKSLWWLWCLLLLFIIVLCISLKDLFRGGDNAKEVAKEEKRVEMSAVEVVTTPIESEQFVLNEPAEVEKLVPVDTPVEEPEKISTTYKIGDYYNENGKQGVVFEVWANGRHGKIVSLDETIADWSDAIDWCRKKGADWYLPAMDDLKAIFNSKSAINSTLAEYGVQLTNGWHWSSTEDSEFCGWRVVMYGGGTLSYGKDEDYYVRAVSAF